MWTVRNQRPVHFESYSSFSYCKQSSVYRVFWPSDRVVDCIHIDFILTLDYWARTLDIQNYAILTKILPFLTARYSSLCPLWLQPTRNNCAVGVQWCSSVNIIHWLFGLTRHATKRQFWLAECSIFVLNIMSYTHPRPSFDSDPEVFLLLMLFLSVWEVWF